jgi:hypothetical protein
MSSKRLVWESIQPASLRRHALISTCGTPSITQTSMSLSRGAVDMGCHSMRAKHAQSAKPRIDPRQELRPTRHSVNTREYSGTFLDHGRSHPRQISSPLSWLQLRTIRIVQSIELIVKQNIK